MIEQFKLGFKYEVEALIDGRWETIHEENLVPTEGMNYMLSTILKATTPIPVFYVSLFEGNYNPTIAITAAAYVAAATECVAYNELTRPIWTGGAVANGAVDNFATPAEFNFAVPKTIYGAALVSSPVKADGSGTILSIVRFASPRVNPDLLRVKAGIALLNS